MTWHSPDLSFVSRTAGLGVMEKTSVSIAGRRPQKSGNAWYRMATSLLKAHERERAGADRCHVEPLGRAGAEQDAGIFGRQDRR